MRFTGSTRIALVLKGSRDFTGQDPLYYTCKINNRDEQHASPDLASGRMTIATDLVATEEYTLRCGRSSEAAYGETILFGIEADAGVQPLVPAGPRTNELRYEAIGDSITAGHKTNGVVPGVAQNPTTENNDVFQSWVRRLADGWATSEWRVVAKSGIGASQVRSERPIAFQFPCRSYTPNHIPTCSPWNFEDEGWEADVVTINLGTNDHAFAAPVEFKRSYKDLISLVRARYPRALIMCIAPLIFTCSATTMKWQPMIDDIQAAVTELSDDKVRYYSTGTLAAPWLSCANDYVDFIHPSGPGNVKFADRLLANLTQDVRHFFPSKCGGTGKLCETLA